MTFVLISLKIKVHFDHEILLVITILKNFLRGISYLLKIYISNSGKFENFLVTI